MITHISHLYNAMLFKPEIPEFFLFFEGQFFILSKCCCFHPITIVMVVCVSTNKLILAPCINQFDESLSSEILPFFKIQFQLRSCSRSRYFLTTLPAVTTFFRIFRLRHNSFFNHEFPRYIKY